MADSNKPLVVGLAGFGTVGGGLARLLEENAGIIRQRTGRDIQVKKVLVRNAQKARTVPLPPGADLTTNPDELINDPELDVLVELMGGPVPEGRRQGPHPALRGQCCRRRPRGGGPAHQPGR